MQNDAGFEVYKTLVLDLTLVLCSRLNRLTYGWLAVSELHCGTWKWRWWVLYDVCSVHAEPWCFVL